MTFLLKKGSVGPDVKKLQEGLAALGFKPGGADGYFGPKTEEAVEAFQEKVKTWPDGLFGRASAAEWDKLCDAKKLPQFKFNLDGAVPDPVEPSERLSWVKVPADPLRGGYSYLWLRSDAAEAYKALFAEVKALGGVITTAGGKRALSVSASASQSKTSFHYTGRAFDLALGSGMNSVAKDPFITVRDGTSRYFTVWCKTDDPSVPVVTLNACICRTLKNAQGKSYTQLSYQEWTGRAFNFTALAYKAGFKRIAGRSSFFSGGSYSGAEWWHFQWETGMVTGKTTFGEELLKAYSLADCQKFVYWNQVKDAVFGVSFG